jgi:acyl-CoA synthetase (NDP forming)
MLYYNQKEGRKTPNKPERKKKMKIYEVSFYNEFSGEWFSKFYATKEKAEAVIKATDKPWTNKNGVEHHTVILENEIEVEE